METTSLEVKRYGRVMFKGAKTDPVYQETLVREWTDGDIEYRHPQTGKWHIPSPQLMDAIKNEIRWHS